MGGEINVPYIIADKVEVTGYIDVQSPTQKSVDIDAKHDQHGIEAHIEKIELADNQTRVYMTVTNNSEYQFSSSIYEAKLIIGNKQFDVEDNFESDLPEIQYDLAPGVESKGVLQFAEVNEDPEQLSLHLDGYSDNYDLDFSPFKFDITID